MSELAAKSGVSDATVIRASQKIGSSSYQDLKISLAQDIVTPLQSVNEEIEAGDPTNVVVEKVFQGILHTLNYTYRLQDGGMLERAADMLLGANRICICGLGNSHAIAEDIQHKLMRLGLNATAYSDNHLQVICSSFLKKGDVLFAVSHSGSSRDVVHAAEIAHECRPLAACGYLYDRTAHGLERNSLSPRGAVVAYRADGDSRCAVYDDSA